MSLTRKALAGLVLAVAFLSVPAAVLYGSHLSEGVNRMAVLITNPSGDDAASLQAPFNVSSQVLVDGIFMDSDGLDTDIREGSSHVAFMPGTGKVPMLACFNNSATNETAACNSSAADDITLPVTGSEVYEFAADNQFRHLHVDVTTPAVAGWTVQWQYWNGSAYTALPNVQDNTDQFTTEGSHRISWDFPAVGLWPQSVLHSISGYWVRAEITAVTDFTSAPTGGQVWYETGRWWASVESLAADEQIQYQAHFDVPDSDKTFHYYFPHGNGITTSDDATIELTGSSVVEIKGGFDLTAPLTGTEKRILFKEDAFELTIPAEGIIQLQITEAP